MNIGENIRNYRKKNGFTQQQLADKMDVSYQAVSCWENDEYVPELQKIEQLAKILNVSVAQIIGDSYEQHWDLHDRMFSEEHMYTFLQSATHAKGLEQAARCLPIVKKLHKGQIRKGAEQVPYIYHPLMIACHALALGMEEDEIIATALLHDVVEDCGVTVEELTVSETVKEAVSLLSFQVMAGESKKEAKKRYYYDISNNRLATVVKILDRCNNISSMAVAFSREKMVEYIDETEYYVMPLLDCMKHNYLEFYNASFLLKYQMRAVLESLKRTLCF